MGFSLGLFIGMVSVMALHLYAMTSYKKILVMKSKDGTSECINGKFYYIQEESEVNQLSNWTVDTNY